MKIIDLHSACPGGVLMNYHGMTITFHDEIDPDKAIEVGVAIEEDGTLYLAFTIDGRRVLRNAKYTRDGKWNGGRQPHDKWSFLYLNRESILKLYDMLGALLEGECEPLPVHPLPGIRYDRYDNPDSRPSVDTDIEKALEDFL